MAKNWMEGIVTGMAGQMRDYGSLQAERTKLESSLLANRLEQEQNYFYKMKAAKAQQDMENENIQKQYEWYKNLDQQPPEQGGVSTAQPDLSQDLTQGKMRFTGKGITFEPPSNESMLLGRLNAMEKHGVLSPENKELKERLMNKVYGKLSQPKSESSATQYNENFRNELQGAVQRIQDGEDYKIISNELKQKFPDKVNFNVSDNLMQVAKQSKVDLARYRNTAIQELKKAKYPITDSNINAAIKQLRGK